METIVVILKKRVEDIFAEKMEIQLKKEKIDDDIASQNKKELIPFIAELFHRLIELNNAMIFVDNRYVYLGEFPNVRLLSRKSKVKLDFQKEFKSLLEYGTFSEKNVIFKSALGFDVWLNKDGKMNYTGLPYSFCVKSTLIPTDKNATSTPKSIDAYVDDMTDFIIKNRVK